jgi:hypothetical protein
VTETDPEPPRLGPRYRVLAVPWYDHDGGEGGHNLDCAAGYQLHVGYAPRYRGDVGDDLGVLRIDAPLDAGHARDEVIAWLRLRAEPRVISTTPADVDLYVRVPHEPADAVQEGP